MSKSEFADWFERQHGKRGHYKRFRGTLDYKLKEIMNAGKDAEFELSQRWSWDTKQTSALYGWQARDQDRREQSD